MLLCLFFSFFLITFIETALVTTSGAMWIVVPMITLLGSPCFITRYSFYLSLYSLPRPCAAALGCQVYTITASSLIFSFYKLDPEILGRVVEEKEEIQNIERLLREKLLNKLRNATSGEEDEMEVGCFFFACLQPPPLDCVV